MQSSFLTLIPKPDKDHTLYANYRPIALLNTDLKIFMKLLSLKLNKILLSLIHNDQVGFVPWRQAGDNTRRIINLISIANLQNMQALLLSLAAENAFDSWSFLFKTLEYLGFSALSSEQLNTCIRPPPLELRLVLLLLLPSCYLMGQRKGVRSLFYCLLCVLSPFRSRFTRI